jgi:ATP-binding cassette subfamily B protein
MKSARKLIRFLKPYWQWVLLAPLLMMLEVVMDLLQPRLIQRIIDEGIAHLDMALVVQTGLLMVGLAVVGLFGGAGNGFLAVKAVQGFGADLREALFRRVQQLSFANLDKLETGQLVTRLTNDVMHVQDALLTMLRILIRAPFLLVGSLIMAVLTSPSLAFIPLVLIPILLAVVVWIVNRATPLYAGVQHWLDGLNEVMQENLAGARVVKAFVRADHEEARFGRANEALMERTIHVARVTAVTMPFMMLTLNLGVAAVLWYGGIQVTQGGMHIGQVVAFMNYLMITLQSLLMVSMLVIQLARAEASADRIAEVLESVPVVRASATARRDLLPQGQVAFEHVSFSYRGADGDAVLKDISFTATPGQMVALVGTTGAGKSSLVHLIPRFYDVSDGAVTLDGVNVREVDEGVLHRHIGVALQETVLFSGSIRDNIRFGRPDASEEEVIAAAKMAQAHDFVTSFPEGYDTLVGQRGVNLSGGQKQRLAIARALLIQPAVLILDDSTSSVDMETEIKIQDALRVFMRGRTCFVIAQRISTVLNADKILVLDGGRLVAEGTHRELLAQSAIYREICASQLGNGATQHG